MTGFDASPALLAVARERLPTAEFREGDLEELPFADASFDAVVAINSVFFAADMEAAMRKLVRVVRPGGRVVVTAWGPPERCEIASAVFPRLRPLAPPPPPGAPVAAGPGLAAPGALAALLSRAGLRVLNEGEAGCPFVFPSTKRFGPTAVPGSTSPRCSSIAGIASVAPGCDARLAYPTQGDRICAMDAVAKHRSHPEIVKRLRRAEGHLRSVIAMIEAERPCLEIAQQMHAVEKAIGQAKKALIEDHLDHCLDAVVGPMDAGQRQEIADFKAIAKYL